MKKFRVYAKTTAVYYINVEAEDEAQAKEMAEEIDGGDFHPFDEFNNTTWEFTDVDPLEDDDYIDYTASEIL